VVVAVLGPPLAARPRDLLRRSGRRPVRVQHPARPATGIASARRRGTIRATTAGATHAAISAESSVPSTRNGTAWNTIATNTVAHACSAGSDPT
jgi:hypothetical protein